MSTIQNLFQQAQLAEAAYANFINPDTGTIYNTDAGIQAALIASGFSRDLNNPTQSAQATALVANWRVVDHLPNTASGFSATLFEKIVNGVGTGVFSLSIRGSERPTNPPGLQDWLNANFNDIADKGLAVAQAIDLYNYWQSLHTVAGGSYQAAKLQVLTAETATLSQLWNDALDNVPGALGAYQAYKDELQGQGWFVHAGTVNTLALVDSTTLPPSSGLATGREMLSASAPVEVSGHSLGGHLALILGRLAPSEVTDVTTLNAPLFYPFTSDTLTESFFSKLRQAEIAVKGTSNIGEEFAAGSSENLVVGTDRVHFFGTLPTGTQKTVFSEGDSTVVIKE